MFLIKQHVSATSTAVWWNSVRLNAASRWVPRKIEHRQMTKNQRQIEKLQDGVLHPNVGISTTVHFHRIQSHSEGGNWGGRGFPSKPAFLFLPAGRAAQSSPAGFPACEMKVKANCHKRGSRLVLGSLALLYFNSTISLEDERDN